MNPELVPFGTSIREVLSRRDGVAEDWQLFLNVVALLMYRIEASGVEELGEVERNVHSIGGMLRDVNNGGWEQFFANSDPISVRSLLPALTAVGSIEFKPLAAEALARWSAENENQEWDAFDERFYACEEQLETLALLYLEHNIFAVRT